MNRYALVKNKIVVNIIIWDGSDTWKPGDGVVAILLESHSQTAIGYSYDGNVFSPN